MFSSQFWPVNPAAGGARAQSALLQGQAARAEALILRCPLPWGPFSPSPARPTPVTRHPTPEPQAACSSRRNHFAKGARQTGTHAHRSRGSIAETLLRHRILITGHCPWARHCAGGARPWVPHRTGAAWGLGSCQAGNWWRQEQVGSPRDECAGATASPAWGRSAVCQLLIHSAPSGSMINPERCVWQWPDLQPVAN